MLSDHSCLYVKIGKSSTYKRCKLNLKKTNWDTFKELLDQLDWPKVDLHTPERVEEATSYLTDNIMNIIKDITPKFYITGKHRKDSWWNENLRQMRRDLRVARNTLAYQELKSAYQKAVRKAKKESWNNFLESCTTMSSMSKFARIIN